MRAVSLIVLASSAARPASAQPMSSRPLPVFRGLFGPTVAEQTRPRSLDVNWSLYEAGDDNSFLTTDADILDATLQARQMYSGATISMLYTRRPPHRTLTLSATGAGRYYANLREIVTTRYGGGMTFDTLLTRDWRIQTSNSASFSPFYQIVLAPSAPSLWTPDTPGPTADHAVSRQHAMQYGSFVGATHTISTASSLAFNYAVRYTQVLEGLDSNTQRAGFTYLRGITKDVAVRLGYAYGVAHTGTTAPPIQNQDIDVGLNYGRAFTPSKRTSISFSSGSSIISSGDGPHFRVTGSARLNRRLAPRWSANVSYDRGLQVPDGASRPFFSDSIAASVSGYFSRRASLRVQPSFSHGVVGFTGLTNSYNSFSSTTRLEVAVSHRLAAYLEHFYYKYQFANGVGLPALLTSGVNRQGVRVGLTLWTPLVQ
jgi:hypothetical protein